MIEKLDKTVSNVSHGSHMPAQVITYIDNVKVIDYHLNFFKQSSTSEPAKSTPSKFENRSKKSVAEAEETKSGDEVSRKTSYLNLLTDPIVLFNKGRYESSLEQFNQILKINPGDQNASFYSGLCHFHLKDYSKALKLLKPIAANSRSPFYEEAEFYKARTLIVSGKTSEGKQLLEQIVNKKGFYANQAAEELTKIKP
jgi:tetratricopeptide (TPR) repeat protein